MFFNAIQYINYIKVMNKYYLFTPAQLLFGCLPIIAIAESCYKKAPSSGLTFFKVIIAIFGFVFLFEIPRPDESKRPCDAQARQATVPRRNEDLGRGR